MKGFFGQLILVAGRRGLTGKAQGVWGALSHRGLAMTLPEPLISMRTIIQR